MNRRAFCSLLGGWAAIPAMASVAGPQDPKNESDKKPATGARPKAHTTGYEIPRSWRRSGLIIQRSMSGPGSSVVGDPCIVRDDDIDGWRMFLFFAPPGCGQAVCPAG